jgi:hypothetical protein
MICPLVGMMWFYGKLLCLFDSIFQLSCISLSLAPVAWLARPIQFLKLAAACGLRWRLAEGCDVHTLYICRMFRNRFGPSGGKILLRKYSLKLSGWHEISGI